MRQQRLNQEHRFSVGHHALGSDHQTSHRSTYCSAERVALVGRDTHIDHVAVFFKLLRCNRGTVAALTVLATTGRLFAAVQHDLTQRSFHCAQRNLATGSGLRSGLSGQQF